MARLQNVPFEPNMADCRMTVKTDGAVCYIMDTFCRTMTKEEKIRTDRKILQIAMDAARRRKASGSA